MNTSHAFSQWNGSGYVAIYSPYWTTAQMKVTDERGQVRVFHDRWQAESFAWRRLYEAEQRIEAIRLSPGQVKLPAQPRSKSGKRAFVEMKLRKALKEIAG
jgi:hypothetical protein